MAPAQQRLRAGEARLHIVKKKNEEKKTTESSEPSSRVLRIGIVESGRIVEEKIIGAEKDVTVGHSERNDFVVTDDRLPPRHKLFEFRGGRYYLSFTEDMTGRVSFPGGFSELSVLASSGKVRRIGRNCLLELGREARGKVVLGESTLLFQMVRPPALQPKPRLPATVRGGWLKSVDWFFSALIALSFLAQFGLVVWLVERDWPLTPQFELRADIRQLLDNTRPSQADIESRLEKMRHPDDLPTIGDIPSMAPDEFAPSQRSDTLDRRLAATKRADAAAAAESRAAESRRRVKAAIADEAARLIATTGLIGSLNEDGDGAVADVLRGGRITDDLDIAMAEADGVEVASSSSSTVFRRPSGRKTGGDAVDIAGLIGSGGGGQEVASEAIGEEAPVTGRIKRGAPAVSSSSVGSLNAQEVRRVVGGSLSAIKLCYERSLRRNRSLQGRVTINFTIGSGGRVTRAQAVQNLSAAPEVGSCIETRIRSLRFPSPEGGPVTFQYPFLFEPSH